MNEDVSGFAFPFKIDPDTGGVAWAKGDQKIRQNVMLVLGTRRGERPMLREFGSTLHGLVQQPNDQSLADLLRAQATAVLLQWEPRVIIADSAVSQTPDELHLRLSYFYSNEPTAVGQLSFPVR